MSVVRRLLRARIDLVQAVAYLAERSESAPLRFLAEAEATFARLARFPGMGARYDSIELEYATIRYMPISKFRSWIVFYRPTPDGIEVVRVLHGARDVGSVLAEELGLFGDDGDDAD
ncbi:type II toxin-antitoxin system RelE/ParE family toxin [Paludisphaera sp.]|uniref:type II toxin-antitoxin system RelE/ParE family toxin n=1 Tax=Paludisphaera sp. TaxID=2017432 RepID=UPI00301BFBEB